MTRRLPTRVLVTGASGDVGGIVIRSLRDRYQILATDRRRPEYDLGVEFLQADVTDQAATRELCRGVDCVLHLAADRRLDAPWESLLPNNVIGSHVVFHAAAAAGCRRVVFASSLHAAGDSPGADQTSLSSAAPTSLYGASKALSEALARTLADTSRTSFLCIRIGWVRNLSLWQPYANTGGLPFIVTDRDLSELFACAIEASDDVRFGIFNGISNNRHKAADIEAASIVLGYQPVDDSFDLAEDAVEGSHVGAWPTASQELLLRAAFIEGREAIDAWVVWDRSVNWTDHLDDGSFRLLPLVYDNLSRAGFEHAIMHRLKGIYLQSWYSNLLGYRRLASALRGLRQADVQTLVLGGSALLAMYCARHGLRTAMTDGEILVARADAAAAITCLESLGWSRADGVGITVQNLVSWHDALRLIDPVGHSIELRWHALRDNRQPGADDSFWAGSVEVSVASEPTRALNPTDQFLHVCVQGARWNERPPTQWVADAAVLLQTSADRIDWDRLFRTAHDRLLALPLRTATTYLLRAVDAPIPDHFRWRLRTSSVTRRERSEFRCRTGTYRPRLVGRTLALWFDYLRTRPPLSREPLALGFASYLRQRVEAPSLF